MAPELDALYGERGLVQLHVVTVDVNDDGRLNSRDAAAWAYEIDHDEDGPYTPPLPATVVADIDGALWNMYKEDCGGDTFCETWCHLQPQYQILDRGSVTVDDGSGDIEIDDVEQDLVIEEEGSGSLRYTNIRGSVQHDD